MLDIATMLEYIAARERKISDRPRQAGSLDSLERDEGLLVGFLDRNWRLCRPWLDVRLGMSDEMEDNTA